MKRFFNKKMLAIGLAVGVTVGIGGAAFAYFTSTGSGTGSASTGTTTNFTVNVLAASGGPMLPSATGDPNATPETINYTVVNTLEGDQNFTMITASATTSFSNTGVTGAPACTPADYEVSYDGGTNWVALGTAHTLVSPVTLSPRTDSPTGSETPPYSPSTTDNDTYFGNFEIMLVENSANQDNCEGFTVPLTVTAS